MMKRLKNVSVKRTKSIKETMKQIDQNGLGMAFIVDNEDKLIGTVTDGDIRRALLAGTDLKKPIHEIMNNNPVTSDPDWNEEKIKLLLQKKDVRKKIPSHGTIKIPVLDKNKKVTDIIFASLEKIESFITQRTKIEVKSVDNILIVGGAGYLGSILCRKLLGKGYFVRVLDNLTYGNHGIHDLFDNPKFEFLKGDMRDIQTLVKAVKGMDAVIHLAAIVGDPASAINPQQTIEINYLATKTLAEICKYSQINRFIFASTCSVYGASPTPETKIDETSKLSPVSLYAEMKLKSEEALMQIADENYSPTIFRMATLYGLSPRMRFDLVVNILTIKALKENKFTIFGGNQWRPLLHVKNAADAYIACLENPIGISRKKIFNVGSNDENYQIIDIGRKINKIIPEAKMQIDEKKVDERNYNVSFDKIENILDYKTSLTIEYGIKEIKKAVDDGNFNDYTEQKFSNYKFLISQNKK